MKKMNLIQRLFAPLYTAFNYWEAHAASLLAMKLVYIREWQEPGNPDQFSSMLRITPAGSLYLVEQIYLTNGSYQRARTWTATYGWHSNGHLICIGPTRYLIFDPLQAQLQLEEFPDDGQEIVEIYYEFKEN
jgi:hypothetical protein